MRGLWRASSSACPSAHDRTATGTRRLGKHPGFITGGEILRDSAPSSLPLHSRLDQRLHLPRGLLYRVHRPLQFHARGMAGAGPARRLPFLACFVVAVVGGRGAVRKYLRASDSRPDCPDCAGGALFPAIGVSSTVGCGLLPDSSAFIPCKLEDLGRPRI